MNTHLNTLPQTLESREIYEAAQAYRHAPGTDQDAVIEAYENLKAVIVREAIEKTLARADEMRNELNCSCLNCVLKALHKELKPAKVTNP